MRIFNNSLLRKKLSFCSKMNKAYFWLLKLVPFLSYNRVSVGIKYIQVGQPMNLSFIISINLEKLMNCSLWLDTLWWFKNYLLSIQSTEGIHIVWLWFCFFPSFSQVFLIFACPCTMKRNVTVNDCNISTKYIFLPWIQWDLLRDVINFLELFKISIIS